MKLNENGFTYPLTLSLLVLFNFFLLINVEHYLAEKRMYSQTKVILQQEYYMMTSVKKLEELLINNPISNLSGTYQYENGVTTYVIEPVLNTTTMKVTITFTLHSGEKFIGVGIYDKAVQKMVKWTERN